MDFCGPHENSQGFPVGIHLLLLTHFPVAKMYKKQWDRNRNMDKIMEISVTHGQTPLFCSEN